MLFRHKRGGHEDSLLLLLGLLVLFLRVLWATDGVSPVDDAYISFRYARNLAEGHGLVFNLGERVEGYTNFLWTVLLAGGNRVGVGPVLCSRVLSTLAAGGTIVLLLWLGRRVLGGDRDGAVWAGQGTSQGTSQGAGQGTGQGADHATGLGAWLPGLPPLLFAAMGSQARLVATGMETLLFTLLVTATACAAVRGVASTGRPSLRAAVAAGGLAALAAMTRPEGLLYGGLAGLYLGLTSMAGGRSTEPGTGPDPFAPIRTAGAFGLCFLALYGPYFLWRLEYYGHPLPNTFYAKTGTPWPARLEAGWADLLRIGDRWGIWPLLVLALFALPSVLRCGHRAFAGVLIAAAAVSFVAVGGDFLVFFGPRFLVPALPFLLLLAAEGLRVLCRPLAPGRPRGVVAALGAAILVGHAAWLTWPAAFWRFPGMESTHRAWKATGLWISERAGEGETLATGAAGVIPYVSGLRSIDLFGLTDEHIAHEGEVDPAAPPGHQKSHPAYVLSREPDFLVVSRLDEQGVPLTARLGWVAGRIERSYELVAQVKTGDGPPRSGRWVAEVEEFRPDLYRRGYRMGVFRRREPRALQP